MAIRVDQAVMSMLDQPAGIEPQPAQPHLQLAELRTRSFSEDAVDLPEIAFVGEIGVDRPARIRRELNRPEARSLADRVVTDAFLVLRDRSGWQTQSVVLAGSVHVEASRTEIDERAVAYHQAVLHLRRNDGRTSISAPIVGADLRAKHQQGD